MRRLSLLALAAAAGVLTIPAPATAFDDYKVELSGTMGYTFSEGFYQLFFVRALTGIGGGLGGAMWGPMGGPVWQALVADMSPPEERGKIMGMMGTIGSIISSPASWTGGYLFDNVSPQLPFQLSFVIDMIGTVIFVMFLKTKPKPNEATPV